MTMKASPQTAQQIARALTLAERHRLAGLPAEADRLCRSLLAAHPQSFEALNYLAMLVWDRGSLDEAEALLRRAIEAAPREATPHNNLGSLLRQTNDLVGSENAYRRAIALKNDYTEAYYNLGIVSDELGQGEQALAAQRRAVLLKPSYAQAHVQIGALLHRRGENTDALRSLDAAVAADPKFFDAHYYRGTVLAALGRFDEAVVSLQAAAKLRPERFEAHYALGNALAAAGQEAAALAAYQRSIEVAPDFLPAHYEYNSLAYSMGQDVRDLKSYSTARKRVGDTPDLLLAEAELRMRFNDAPAAEALLRRAQSDGRADIADALGRALGLQARFGESVAFFQKAIESEPDVVRHRQELGVALLHDHQSADARRVLLEAYALAPFDQATLGYLTMAYRELGDSAFGTLVDIDKYVREYELPVPSGFADAAAFNAALAEELAQLHTRRAEPIDQTLRHGTQTAGSLFGRTSPVIKMLQESIRQAVAQYVRNLPADAAHPFLSRRDEEFDFAGSWSCRLQSSGYHTNHVHSQGWISSAYYVSLPDAVREGQTGEGWLKFGESKFFLGERDRPIRSIRPTVGKLVLFPSFYWHGTVPFTSEQARLTVAFDVVPGKAPPVQLGSRNY